MNHYGPLVRILHCCISQAVSSNLSDMELTSAQGHIMGYLARCKEPPCPRDLEEEFHLSHPTVSGLLARLEKKDFIALQPDPKDRRCKRICILPKGQECHDRMHRSMLASEEQIVQGFSDEEKALFADMLSRAIRNMGVEPNSFFPKEETNR